jgi:pimeloyl-ACP methyl ester carboxylesterase
MTERRRVGIHRALGRAVACNFALGWALLASGCGSNEDPSIPPASLAQACAAFAPVGLPHGATILRTELRGASGTLPEVCVVRGQIASANTSTITWAVELPDASRWNGKTLTIGGGGFDGFIPTDTPNYQRMVGPAANDFIKISSDSGHQTRGFGWAVDDIALRNHAYQANHFSLGVGTAIAQAFYGRAPSRRYMFGHSNGGRSGLAAAQRYPGDYDGIVALEPAISQQSHEANVGPLLERHIYSSPLNWLSPAKVKLFAQAELAACDQLDGLKDGILGNIEACNYVPNELLCTGADNDGCLTAGQIETIRLIYADKNTGVVTSFGQTGYPRFGRGGAATSDWDLFLFGTSFAARDAFNYFVADEAARVAERSPVANGMTHDPALYQSEYTRMSAILDSTDPDLRAFADRGGKLIIWYGLADTCVPVYRTAEYFESVKRLLGETATNRFARFLASPGTGHALDGPGAAQVDWISAIDTWVENRSAPDALVASRMQADGVTPLLQRPVCPYAQFPRYQGGNPARAESFNCATS